MASRVDDLRQMLRDENFSGIENALAALLAGLHDPGAFEDAMAIFRDETNPDVLAYLAQM